MADKPVVHIGENSPEQVAYKMTETILIIIEKKNWGELDRKTYLDTYAECFEAAYGMRKR